MNSNNANNGMRAAWSETLSDFRLTSFLSATLHPGIPLFAVTVCAYMSLATPWALIIAIGAYFALFVMVFLWKLLFSVHRRATQVHERRIVALEALVNEQATLLSAEAAQNAQNQKDIVDLQRAANDDCAVAPAPINLSGSRAEVHLNG